MEITHTADSDILNIQNLLDTIQMFMRKLSRLITASVVGDLETAHTEITVMLSNSSQGIIENSYYTYFAL